MYFCRILRNEQDYEKKCKKIGVYGCSGLLIVLLIAVLFGKKH